MNFTLINMSTSIIYLISSILQWMVIGKKYIPKKFILSLVGVGMTLHTASLYHMIFSPQGLALSIFSTTSLICWVVLIIVSLGCVNQKLDNIFAVFLPFVAFVVFISWFFYRENEAVVDLQPGIIFHIIVSVLMFSVFSIAAIQACFFAFQSHMIKNHLPNIVLKVFPPLETMERLLINFIIAGMVLLTSTLMSGLVFINELKFYHWFHQIFLVLTVSVWFLFAIFLFGHFAIGWRGKKTIFSTLLGYALLLISYFGVKIFVGIFN